MNKNKRVKTFFILLISFFLFFSLSFIYPTSTLAHTDKLALASDEMNLDNIAKIDTSIKSIRGLSNQITGIALNKDTLKSKGLQAVAKESAIERKTKMLELAKESPEVFLNNVISKEISNKLPAEIKKEVESETTITGKINVVVFDDFKTPENSSYGYKLTSDGKEYNFYPANADLPLLSGTRIKINGYKLDDTIVVNLNDKDKVKIIDMPPIQDSVGKQNMLVFLVEFADTTIQRPFTQKEAYDAVFNDQFQKFYKEQSYEKVWFTGTVTPWIKINRNLRNTYGDGYLIDKEIKEYILNNNVDLSNYGRIVFLVHHQSTGGRGQSDLGKRNNCIIEQYFCSSDKEYYFSQSWISALSFNESLNKPFKWKIFDELLSHELGHAFGLLHATGLDCNDKIISDDCNTIAYGNLFDIMGDNLYSLHFNALYKDLLKWIPDRATQTITKSGIYSLTPLESPLSQYPNTSSKKIAKIIIPSLSITDVPYILEFRKPIGFDIQLDNPNLASSGLFLNKIEETSDYDKYNYSVLFDTTPTTKDWTEDIKDTSIEGNDVFHDKARGLTIGPVVSETNDKVTFMIDYKDPICEQFPPHLESIKDSLSVEKDESVSIDLEIKNLDGEGCKPAKFGTFVEVLDKVSFVINEISSEIKPKKNFINKIKFSSSTSGNYNIKIHIKNLVNGLVSNTQETALNVLPKPIIENIIPTIGNRNTNFTIYGKNLERISYVFLSNQEDPSTFYEIPKFESSSDKIYFKIHYSVPCKREKYCIYNVLVKFDDNWLNLNPITLFINKDFPDLTASPVIPLTATVGKPQTFQSIITNTGGVKAGGVNGIYHIFQFDRDSNHIGGTPTNTIRVTSPSIDTGQSKTISTTVTFTEAGIKYIRVCADNNRIFAGTVIESNEDNNCSPWAEAQAKIDRKKVPPPVDDVSFRVDESGNFSANALLIFKQLFSPMFLF